MLDSPLLYGSGTFNTQRCEYPLAGIIYDPRDRATIDDPIPVLRRLQDEDPVHWSDVLGGWVITRYADVKRVQLNHDISADRLTPFYASLPPQQRDKISVLIHYLNTWVAFKDPPDHTRLRRLMNALLSPRQIQGLRPQIEQAVDYYLDKLSDRMEFDFIRDFAFPLPATVIMFLCGLPAEDMEKVKVWSEMMKPFIGSATASPEKYEMAQSGAIGMAEYFRSVIRQRQARPGDDIISRMIGAQDQHGGLTEDELIGTCMLFLFGGHETTTNLIGNGTRALIRFSEARNQILREPRLIDSAIEEILRYDGPTGAVVRVVKVAHELHGRQLQAGDRIFIMINAANHDPRQFDAPERFDIRRSPNNHLTFNYGPHFCLGAPLARLEGQIALAQVVKRFPTLSCGPEPVHYMDTLVMRGVRSMPVVVRQPSTTLA
jgi:cytochrome P450